MTEIFIEVSPYIEGFFLLYFGIIIIFYNILFVMGLVKIIIRQRSLRTGEYIDVLHSNFLPNITFLIPAYNEASNILAVVENITNLTYRRKTTIVINDGSTDNMLQILKEKYDLAEIPMYYANVLESKPIKKVYRSKINPQLIVIDKENGTKFDAMNAGLNACKDDFFVSLDADTFIDDEGFNKLIRPFLSTKNLVAMGAGLRILNGSKIEFHQINTNRIQQNFLAGMQTNEYFRAFIMREGWDYLGGNFCLSGAFSIFSTEAVKSIGGYGPTVANDLEIIVRMNRIFKFVKRPYRIRYLPDPVAWTIAPDNLNRLGFQRIGWQLGSLESVWFHRNLFFNPKYGAFGMIAFPFLVIGDIIEPIFELLAYIYIIIGLSLGLFNPWSLLIILCLMYGIVCILSLSCVLVEEFTYNKYSADQTEGLINIMTFAFVENFCYRQLTILWRAQGFLSFFMYFKKIKEKSKKLNKEIKLSEKRILSHRKEND